MEIIKRSVQGPHKFKVLKPFGWKAGKAVEPGEIVEMDQLEADQYVQIGRVIPVDLPDVGTYITLTSFSLPGKNEKFETKKFERVELRAQDALRLMLDRSVIPEDESQWRPRNARLLKDGQKPQGLGQRRIEGIEEGKFQQKVWEMGLPSQKGRP